MKRLNYIAGFVAALLLFGSCSNWLDVKPRGQMAESEAFDSERGFQTVLIGAYWRMATTGLYGENTTMYIPEFLAQHWLLRPETNNETNREEEHWLNYNYQENRIKSRLTSVWTNYYRTIAQLNVLLMHLEDTDVGFSGNNKALIYGEAIGLRAFLHLDLLRFFGPVPGDAVGNAECLPYMRELTRDAKKLASITWDEYTALLLEDLEASYEALKDIDPITLYTQDDMPSNDPYREDPTDPWESMRKRRFNYYAAAATLARYYAWMGDTTMAAEYAKEVIDALNYQDNPLFGLATNASMIGSIGNYTMNTEHIFGLQNSDMLEVIEPKYLGVSNNSMGSTSESNRRMPVYSQTSTNLEKASCLDYAHFPVDMRGLNNYWTKFTGQEGPDDLYTYNKYVKESEASSLTRDRIPVIRVAEMYLILFEGMSTSDPYVSDKLRGFMDARGNLTQLEYAREIYADAIKMERDGAIEREYRKEFYAEGQMFFFYKRHKYNSFVWPNVLEFDALKYVLPKPDVQIDFEELLKNE